MRGQRRSRSRARSIGGRWLALVAAATLLGGCGATAGGATGVPSAPAAGRASSQGSPGGADAGALPLGDGHVGSAPRVGYVDSCTTSFRGGGGAQTEGPWIDAQAGTWSSTAKIAVQGSVRWRGGSYRVKTALGRRVITFNDLPIGQPTGVFPIASSDPAYAYDRNPNHIAAQSFRWSLPLHPKAARKASCTGLGPIGVLEDGVALFNALDAAGRDAGAHEVQDACQGHPDGADVYHYHEISRCILDRAPDGRTTLVGYALDGYGIYVQKNARGALPTDAALDACHGKVSKVRWNGRRRRVYHYVATLEYPYTVGCFHGTPIAIARARAPRRPAVGAAGGQPRGSAAGAPRPR